MAILVTLSGMVILVSELQRLNAERSIVATPSGIVTLVSELQLLNAQLLILVTLSGMVMLVSPLHSEKVKPLSAIIFVGTFMLSNFFEYLKAIYPIPVTLSGILSVTRFLFAKNALG